MDKIYEKLKMKNKGFIRHMVLFVTLSLWAVSSIISDELNRGLSLGYIPVIISAFLLGTLVPWEFVRKYTTLGEDSGDEIAGSLSKAVAKMPLANLVRFNSFNVNDYFKILFKKYATLYLISVVLFTV